MSSGTLLGYVDGISGRNTCVLLEGDTDGLLDGDDDGLGEDARDDDAVGEAVGSLGQMPPLNTYVSIPCEKAKISHLFAQPQLMPSKEKNFEEGSPS